MQQENTSYRAICVPTKQLEEKLRENTRAAVTSNLLLAQISIHIIHFKSLIVLFLIALHIETS